MDHINRMTEQEAKAELRHILNMVRAASSENKRLYRMLLDHYQGKFEQRGDIFLAITNERAYQDNKYGTPEERDLSIGEYIAIASAELTEASDAPSDQDALLELLQVVAVGIACIERHGLIERQTAQNAQEGR